MQHYVEQMDIPLVDGHKAPDPLPGDVFGTALQYVVAGVRRRDRPQRRSRFRAEELVLADRRKDEFLAMVSHELRSPLASIHNTIRLLGSQADRTPEQQKTQALLERQVRRMTHLVDDLLDVSRIANGRMALHLERVDLRVVVNHAIETLAQDIHARNHRLTTASHEAPVWLQADPLRLEQVFVNLIANAVKYTDLGGEITVWIQARNRQAVIRVRDSGIGISSSTLPHVFDLFKQANETDPRSKSGLGIGLAVVRNLVELHGGSVTAMSGGSRQGSEFTVRLPMQD